MALLKKLFIKQAENKKFGVVDKNGNWFLEPKHSKAWRTGRYIVIGRKGKWAVIDALKGTWLENVKDIYFDNVDDSFEYGALKLEQKIDNDEEYTLYLFDNGDEHYDDEVDTKLEIAEEEDSDFDYIYKKPIPHKDENGKWGYVNEKGKWVIPPRYDLAKAFVNGTAIVKVESKYGIINDDGYYEHEPVLDDAWSWEEFIIARQGEKDEWGVMDRYGEWLCGGNLHTIEGPTIRNKEANIITHDYLDLWDDNGDGNKLFSGGTFEEIDDYGIYYKGFEEDDD